MRHKVTVQSTVHDAQSATWKPDCAPFCRSCHAGYRARESLMWIVSDICVEMVETEPPCLELPDVCTEDTPVEEFWRKDSWFQ